MTPVGSSLTFVVSLPCTGNPHGSFQDAGYVLIGPDLSMRRLDDEAGSDVYITKARVPPAMIAIATTTAMVVPMALRRDFIAFAVEFFNSINTFVRTGFL